MVSTLWFVSADLIVLLFVMGKLMPRTYIRTAVVDASTDWGGDSYTDIGYVHFYNPRSSNKRKDVYSKNKA